MSSMPVELYTDGSCLKNPGPGGLAYIIRYWVDNGTDMPEVKEIDGNQGFRLTTNNRMEIMAGIYGLKAVIDNINAGIIQSPTQINLSTDSQYFCNAVNQGWLNRWQQNNWMTSGFRGSQPQPVKNKDLWEQVIEVQKQLRQMSINLSMSFVKGHATDELKEKKPDPNYEWNDKADKLAVAASTGLTHIADEVYEKTTIVVNRR